MTSLQPISENSSIVTFQPETNQVDVTSNFSTNLIFTTVNDFFQWSFLSSLWPLLYGTSCCFIEFAALIGSNFDFDRFGLVPRSSPRQADLIITAGTVTMKMAPSLIRLYNQMPNPKYVIAMGACTITGGMFSTDSYSTVRGVDKLIPVDIYLPGCPPKPEAIIDAIVKLRKQIAQKSLTNTFVENKQKFYTVKHSAQLSKPIHTGLYLESQKRLFPSKKFSKALALILLYNQTYAYTNQKVI